MLFIRQSKFLFHTVFALVLCGTFSGRASAQDFYEVDLPESEFKKVSIEQLQQSEFQGNSSSFSSDYTFIHNNGETITPQQANAVVEGGVGYKDDSNLLGIGISHNGIKTDFFFSNVSEKEYNKATEERKTGNSSESPMNNALKKAEKSSQRAYESLHPETKQGSKTTQDVERMNLPIWDGYDFNKNDMLGGILDATMPFGLMGFTPWETEAFKTPDAEFSDNSE